MKGSSERFAGVWFVRCMVLLVAMCPTAGTLICAERLLEWTELPELPTPNGHTRHLGLAGAFAGVDGDALIVAGGANFAPPVWESQKVWHDQILVLVRDQSRNPAEYRWVTGFSLDKPLAYGSSVSTPRGLLCMGGNDARQTYDAVFLLSWDPIREEVERRLLPSLPQACAYSSAALIGETVYVAGGTTGLELETAQSNFWAIDLSDIDSREPVWQTLPSWPGPPRAFAVAVAQHNGVDDAVYLLSGRRATVTGEVEFLTDVYEFMPSRYDPEAFDPDTGLYTGQVSPWRQRRNIPRSVMAGSAIAVGQSHVFVLGGDDGSLFHQADALKDDHPGFVREALSYHTITDTWTSAGPIPANHVTTTAVRWGIDSVNDPIILASGEVRPRVRSPKVWRFLPVKSPGGFGWIDFSVIGLYLAAMIGMGIGFSFRNENSDDFFRGGQRIPWFVAGLSIFATMLSSITFMAIPAKSYATDWVYFIYNMTAIAIAPLVILLFLPFFRKIDATSAYEYLEKRFNRAARLFASGSFVLFQVGRMAIVLYLPALALTAITPLSEQQCILLMGGLSIVYCALGGLEAVVWTDTVQSFVLMGGALVSLGLIFFQVDGGVTGFLSTATQHGKFEMADWDFSSGSFAVAALWVVVLGGLAQNLVSYSSDMAVVQRYMAVSDLGRARKAIWTNAVAVLPASILFFGVGTALFVFYAHNPGRLDPTFKTDSIFPLFIARELPVGIAGLVVAGIFSAAQSTISTSMNSMSTAIVTDFVRPLNRIRSERGYLRLGRALTVMLGLMGVSLALLFASSDIKSLWDQFMMILGLFGGSMCGLFCLGIFTTRANGPGAIIGALAGAAGLFLVQEYTQVHLLLYALVGISICCAVGYVTSYAFPPSGQSIEGLTIHNLKTGQKAGTSRDEGGAGRER